ncbi:PepSY domain-containing protein [Gammaproteobacteria bacterium]|jgi:uncharacterized iron-regulated membrane protein|nr:PepSY domain-containing protein [Gammaproteobacteria bacterium]
MRSLIRKIHKYLSLFISIQLLLWTVSGIYFAYNKIELVRGEHLRNQTIEELSFDLKNLPPIQAKSIDIIVRLGQPLIKINTMSGISYLNKDGSPASKIKLDEAMKIVQNRTSLNPLSALEIVDVPAGAEYRGRDLPLYQVITDHQDNIKVYLDAFSGEIVAIRSSSWRVWDFLWGLHIMDYIDRDNINNILIKIFSILALISSLSGVILFFITQKKATS